MFADILRTMFPLGFQAILLLMANLCKLGTSNMAVHTATKRSNMDNIITPLRIQWEVTKRGTTLCVAECSNDIECSSVFYNKVTTKCQGHSVTFGLLDNHMTGHGYILDSCTMDADCKVPNSTCWESRQCMCIPGYSFSPLSRQCVYHSFVHTNNLEAFNNILLEDCYSLCRNRTTYTCRSVEYMGSDCILSNVTAKDSVVTFARDTVREYDVSYHQRDCA